MTNRQATLKDRYTKKQSLVVVKDKLGKLEESRQQKLNEEIDQKLLKVVVETIKRLQAINFGTITSLDQARDAAVLDVTRAAVGDQKKGLMNRLASMFRKNDNPVFDALAFGSAIANFFPMLAQYTEALASKGGQQVNDDQSLSELVNSSQMFDAIKKMITKGLRPSGVLAKLGAGWAKKYLKGSLEELVNQIIQTPLSEIKQIAASVKQSTSNISNVGQQVAQRAQQQPQQSGEAPNKVQGAYAKIKDSLGDLDDQKKQTVADVLKALEKQGLLQ
jgi:hypothetical protein